MGSANQLVTKVETRFFPCCFASYIARSACFCSGAIDSPLCTHDATPILNVTLIRKSAISGISASIAQLFDHHKLLSVPNTEVHRGEMSDYPMQETIEDYPKRRDPEWALALKLALKLAKLNDAQFSAGFEQGLQ